MRRRWPWIAALVIASVLATHAARRETTLLPMVGRSAPSFALQRLDDPARTFSPAQMRGRAWVLNVWASWCTLCRDEHAVLLKAARAGEVPLVGVSFRDRPREARAWLAQLGDPFHAVAADPEGRIAEDYGIRGVPATFVIDADGVTRYARRGPLTREVFAREILPLLRGTP